MNYQVVISSQAEQNLINICSYILINGYFDYASRIYEKIMKQINSLSIFPERHPQYETETGRSLNLRIMRVENYNVLYHVNKEKEQVTIILICYMGMDLDSQILRYIGSDIFFSNNN